MGGIATHSPPPTHRCFGVLIIREEIEMLDHRKQIQSIFLASLVVVVTACSPPTAGSGDPVVETPTEPPAGTTREPTLEEIDWYLQSYGPAGH